MQLSSSGPISVLAIGQSNMEGRYGPMPTQFPPTKNVRFWDWKAKSLVPAELGKWPLNHVVGNKRPAGNPAYSFAHAVAQAKGCEVNVGFYASGGKRIEFFLPDSVLEKNGWENNQDCNQFRRSIAPMFFEGNAASFLEASRSSRVDVAIIHQGEANFSPVPDEPEEYAKKVVSLLEELRTSGLIANSTPILLGHISPYYHHAPKHREALSMIDDPMVQVVEWDGIETMADIGAKGNAHATGTGLHELGLRYAEKYLSLTG